MNSFNVLFICTGNSARSIMAEALLKHLGAPRFHAYSAGSMPTGQVNPLSLRTLEKLRLPTPGYRSKSWSEFASAEAPTMDFVFTVCDQAAGEICPVWPGQPISAHWGVPDPAAARGSEAEVEQAFLDVAITLKRRIELMLALPMIQLDRLALHKAVQAIGNQ